MTLFQHWPKISIVTFLLHMQPIWTGPNLDKNRVRIPDLSPFQKNYAKLYFDAKDLMTGLNRVMGNWWCPFFAKNLHFLSIPDTALIFWSSHWRNLAWSFTSLAHRGHFHSSYNLRIFATLYCDLESLEGISTFKHFVLRAVIGIFCFSYSKNSVRINFRGSVTLIHFCGNKLWALYHNSHCHMNYLSQQNYHCI